MIDIDVHKANYHDYSKKQLLRIVGELQDKTYRLEKALDKACNELENYASSYESPWCGRPFTKDQWKEWCMKDGE